jgi:hypothetical protein
MACILRAAIRRFRGVIKRCNRRMEFRDAICPELPQCAGQPMDQLSFGPDRSVDSLAAFARVSPQPFLIFEQRAKGDSDLQVLIAFVSRRKCSRIAQYIAPQFHKFIQAVETLDAGIDGSH